MNVVIDIEANGLENPTQIWLIVCKDIETGQVYKFREVTTNEENKERFLLFHSGVTRYIGHNFLGYDWPVLVNLLGVVSPDVASSCIDTLIISKLVEYSRPGHSIEDYGLEQGIPKGNFSDFSKYSLAMEEYCERDVDICFGIYLKYLKYISDPAWYPAILLEQQFQLIVNDLHNNGFSFNTVKAQKLLDKVKSELDTLDAAILKEFPPKLKLVKEIHPKETKHGTLSKSDFRWVQDGDLSDFNGGPFCRCVWAVFNPSSHKQIVDVLHAAGWSPVDKTQTRIDTEREIQRLKYQKSRSTELDLRLKGLYTKLDDQEKYGWKINENNLATLPEAAPSPARTLAKRILLESRRRTLTEWLGLVSPDDRLHGKFYAIGAWTHRMAHQNPNTANIPTDVKLFGKEMRALWRAPRGRLLVGVDAEGIQLRIFAHYIDDPEFTKALVEGRKDDKTDPHSLNASILGSVCGGRQIAKRFIYALLLGAGLGKLSEILGCSKEEAQEALDRVLKRYQGFAYLREEVIPADAARGWFYGLDGRKVRIPGDTAGGRKHLCMSGYLQNGEVVVMKKATVKFYPELKKLKGLLVNLVHDEWQTECPNDMNIALKIAKLQADSLQAVGEQLKLKCPLAGSYWNEDHQDYTIGTTWSVTH